MPREVDAPVRPEDPMFGICVGLLVSVPVWVAIVLLAVGR
jgi:hypothetical protein